MALNNARNAPWERRLTGKAVVNLANALFSLKKKMHDIRTKKAYHAQQNRLWTITGAKKQDVPYFGALRPKIGRPARQINAPPAAGRFL
ncbi:hypothetical protein [Gibbsiella quercinecans]|uniref:hypothetical protein n=1 Tax=Gibbsiella quercinecans TaxID=929813 RepID=UPI0010442CBE|nr:hypothetical protein [Gibbsiella quercinecans]